MMDSLGIIIERFESFIKRSLMPSASFLMMFILFDIYGNDGNLLKFLDKEHHILMIAVILVIFAGVSTLLTILHQFIYDNRLKANFDGGRCFKNENSELKKMREEVIKALSTSDSNDYMLYQRIGKNMNTKRYIDDVKTIGIFFVSLLIMIIVSVSKYIALSSTSLVSMANFLIVLGTTLVLCFFYKLGKELIKSKYRSRAIRIYTNYLDESEKK